MQTSRSRKARAYRSPKIEELEAEMKKDHWKVKLRRWTSVQIWIMTCRTRFIWDLTYEKNIINKLKKYVRIN